MGVGGTEGAAARTSTSRELPTGEPSRKLDEMALGGVKLQKKTHTTYEQKQNKIQARVPFFWCCERSRAAKGAGKNE